MMMMMMTIVCCRLAEASDPWLKHFWTNSAFRPPAAAVPAASLSATHLPSRDLMTSRDRSAELQQLQSALDSRSGGGIQDELHELERFASSFKARRIRLGFTQTNVGWLRSRF